MVFFFQQFGVIPFDIRTLKKGHTEKWRAQRFYIAAIVRHSGTVGAWRNRGYLRVLLILWSTSLQSSGLQDFLKRLLPKLSATRTLRLCRSLCLRHLREVVCFHLRVLPLSVCLLYAVGLLYHSIFRKNLIFRIIISIQITLITKYKNSRYIKYREFSIIEINFIRIIQPLPLQQHSQQPLQEHQPSL